MSEELAYVVLEPDQEERFLSVEELRAYLAQLLIQEQQLTPQQARQEAQNLIDTACELPLDAGRYCQWYETRVDRPSTRRRDW